MFAGIANDEKLEKKLGPFRKEAELSKELVILERHVPLDGKADLATLAIREDKASIAAYFETLGSKTLMKRLMGGDEKSEPVPQGTLF